MFTKIFGILLVVFLTFPALTTAQDVIVTWTLPESVYEVASFDLRVNESTLINIPGAETRKWSGKVTLYAGKNSFDMRTRTTNEEVSVWSEPCFYLPGICIPQNLGIALDTSLIIDNRDNNTSTVGVWKVSSGHNFYNVDSLYASGLGNSYIFKASVKGKYVVSLWWTFRASRCIDVPIKIYDGETLLDTILVNQRIRSGQWNVLNSYAFTDSVRVVIESQESCSTCADAIRLQ